MPRQLEATPRKVFVGLILLSLATQLFIGLLETGHDATEYGIRDSRGYPLGFNDPLTWGHVRIMFGNVSLAGYLHTVEWYGVLCCLAHLGGLWAVWSRGASGGVRMAYFAAQLFLFPMGCFVLFWIWFLPVLLFQRWEGESIQDGPLNALFAQGIWWLVSFAALIHLLWRDEKMKKAGRSHQARRAKT